MKYFCPENIKQYHNSEKMALFDRSRQSFNLLKLWPRTSSQCGTNPCAACGDIFAPMSAKNLYSVYKGPL